MNPKHSIIIPAYNTGEAICKCIDSVIAQTYPDWELIVVDDGSMDSTPAIIDEYAQRDSRIHAIHIPNGGVSNARNVGLDNAQGEYVMFVDSDDWIEPDYLQQIDNHTDDDADMYITGISLDYESNSHEVYYSVIKGAPSYMFIDSNNLKTRIGYLIQTMNMESSCMKNYKLSFLRTHQIRFKQDMIIFEDFHFVIQCLMQSVSITLIPFISYHYCIPLDYNPCKRRGYRDLYPSVECLFQSLDKLVTENKLENYSKEVVLRTIASKLNVLTSQSRDAVNLSQKVRPFKDIKKNAIFNKYKTDILLYAGGRFRLQNMFFQHGLNYLAYLCNRYL